MTTIQTQLYFLLAREDGIGTRLSTTSKFIVAGAMIAMLAVVVWLAMRSGPRELDTDSSDSED